MVTGMVSSWAEMTIAQKKASVEAGLNAEIISTTSTWVKCRDQIYLMMLSYANEYLLNTINKALTK
jgi:hypothetical protein